MIYGYARVSTAGQAKDGNSLENQREELKKAGCNIIIEECYTGTEVDRPKFSELLAQLQSGDTLVVIKLDRFARNAEHGIHVIRNLVDRGVAVRVLNMGLIDNTPVGRLMITVMLGFAEFERDMIVERTQTGKAVARQNPDFKEGRPAVSIDPQRWDEVQSMDIPVTEKARLLGVSRGTYYKLMKNAAA